MPASLLDVRSLIVPFLVGLLVIGGCGNHPSGGEPAGVVNTGGSGGDQATGAAPLDPQHPGPTPVAAPGDPPPPGGQVGQPPPGGPGGTQGPGGSGGSPYTPNQPPLTPADLDGLVQLQGTASFAAALRATLDSCPVKDSESVVDCQARVRRVFSLVPVTVDAGPGPDCGPNWAPNGVSMVFYTGGCASGQAPDTTVPDPGPDRDKIVEQIVTGTDTSAGSVVDPALKGTISGGDSAACPDPNAAVAGAAPARCPAAPAGGTPPPGTSPGTPPVDTAPPSTSAGDTPAPDTPAGGTTTGGDGSTPGDGPTRGEGDPPKGDSSPDGGAPDPDAGQSAPS